MKTDRKNTGNALKYKNKPIHSMFSVCVVEMVANPLFYSESQGPKEASD